MSEILRRKYGKSTLKRIQKLEELEYGLRKAELYLEPLLRYGNFMANFLAF